ncbi:MAG: hypothetical protein COB29_13295 [Sulfitobacter sp.]|nr:MAG: hypothetical protein COB29_13295 [Sulfitobacter sp.]
MDPESVPLNELGSRLEYSRLMSESIFGGFKRPIEELSPEEQIEDYLKGALPTPMEGQDNE